MKNTLRFIIYFAIPTSIILHQISHFTLNNFFPIDCSLCGIISINLHQLYYLAINKIFVLITLSCIKYDIMHQIKYFPSKSITLHHHFTSNQ